MNLPPLTLNATASRRLDWRHQRPSLMEQSGSNLDTKILVVFILPRKREYDQSDNQKARNGSAEPKTGNIFLKIKGKLRGEDGMGPV